MKSKWRTSDHCLRRFDAIAKRGGLPSELMDGKFMVYLSTGDVGDLAEKEYMRLTEILTEEEQRGESCPSPHQPQ